jgi:trans-aconitate 2-methyltransferase
VTYVEADLEEPLPIDGLVDAVLSTATFHWLLDHDKLFANLASVLRPGGWLVAQCGGFGNVSTLLRIATEVHPGFHRVHNFQTPKATRDRLERSGFDQIDAWLSDAPTPFDTPEQFEAFLETVCLRTYLDELPPEAREPFVKAVAAGMPDLTLDYVRLNITARRAG